MPFINPEYIFDIYNKIKAESQANNDNDFLQKIIKNCDYDLYANQKSKSKRDKWYSMSVPFNQLKQSLDYSKIINNHFNLTNEHDKESCLNQIRIYGKQIKSKIKQDGIEELFQNIEKEIHQIMVEYECADKKDLSTIKERFTKSMTLKGDDSLKVNIAVKYAIIEGIKIIISETIDKEINLLY